MKLFEELCVIARNNKKLDLNYALISVYGGVCTWAIYNHTKDRFDYRQNDICHAGFASSFVDVRNRDSRLTVVTSLRIKRDSIDSAKQFLNFILDPNKSPWREIVKNAELIIEPKSGLPYGILIPDAEKLDFKLLFNFLVLTRMFNERPLFVESWNVLVKNGIKNEVDALWFSTGIQLSPDYFSKKTLTEMCWYPVVRSQHYSFNTDPVESYPNYKTVSLSKLRNAEPIKHKTLEQIVGNNNYVYWNDHVQGHSDIWSINNRKEDLFIEFLRAQNSAKDTFKYNGNFQELFKITKKVKNGISFPPFHKVSEEGYLSTTFSISEINQFVKTVEQFILEKGN